MKLRQLTLNAHLGSVNICAMTFLFVDQCTSTFFVQRGEVVVDHNYFSVFQYVDPFRRYSRSKSEVVRNRAEFFAVSNFRETGLPKVVPILSPQPYETSPRKVS